MYATKAEYEAMVKVRRCRGGIKLECSGLECRSKPKLNQQSKWFDTVTSSGSECAVTPIAITAKNVDDTLLNSDCKAKDLRWIIDHTTVI